MAVKRKPAPDDVLSRTDRFAGRGRAFVKVQDGCDAFCSYCIVPYTRCRVWSKDVDDVVAECRDLVAAGHLEIVLTGVCLGAFGRDTTIRQRWKAGQPDRLPELVDAVAAIEGLWLVRLSSLACLDVTDRLLAVCTRLANFAPHFHVPLQSGSARILKRMNRQYTSDDFLAAVGRIRDAFDQPAVTTDVIVGFPGEDPEDFAATLDVAERAGLTKIHAFPFSPIEPTAAWHWRDDSPPLEVVRSRLDQLGKLEARNAAAYLKQFVGTVMPALVERARSGRDGYRQAMTDRYLRVRFQPAAESPDPTGQVVNLRIDRTDGELLYGTPPATDEVLVAETGNN